jgi:ATP-binding cassette subfamily B protein RaxB
MLSLQGERLADIVLSPEDEAIAVQNGSSGSRSVRDEYANVIQNNLRIAQEREVDDFTLELRNLNFRYAEGEPWILKNVNLTLQNKESIAIIGPSGCGKSTLMKLMVGLLSPTEGEILLGGIPIKWLGANNYRRQIGVVMQEDQLLTGTIADNINFFDLEADQTQVEVCAKAAAMHGEIMSMPMGYQTLLGDMGSTLSGGQKQRVLLARALYKRPKILFLDEATSHLDMKNEHAVSESIKLLDVTKIIIAHRLETIQTANRVIEIKDGLVSDVAVPTRDSMACSEAGDVWI